MKHTSTPYLANQRLLDGGVTLEEALNNPDSYRIKIALFIGDIEDGKITVSRNLLIWLESNLCDDESFKDLTERIKILLQEKYKVRSDIPNTWRDIVEDAAAMILNN